MRLRPVFAFVCLMLFAGALAAQTPLGYVTVSGSNVSDSSSGGLVTNATISFQPVDNNGKVISFRAGGPGGQRITTPVTTQVTSGAFSLIVADSSLTTPANVCYKVTITDNSTGNSLLGGGYACVQPSGSGVAVTGGDAWCTAATGTAGGTCNFDNYTPDLTSGVVVQTGPAGPAGPTGPAGVAGPNSVTVSTTTNINGLLGGNGSTIQAASAAQVDGVLGTLTDCGRAGYIYSPPAHGCIPAGAGSVSGQANGVFPLGTGPSTIGAQSHCDDGVTSGGTVTCSEPVQVPSVTTAGGPTNGYVNIKVTGTAAPNPPANTTQITGVTIGNQLLNASLQPVAAPAFIQGLGLAGPYINLIDDFAYTTGFTSRNIGSPTGASCLSGRNDFDDPNHTLELRPLSGTTIGAGISCDYFTQAIGNPSTSMTKWIWKSSVIAGQQPSVLAASYQAGVYYGSGSTSSSPWTHGFGFYLSSTNANQNNWYIEYETSSSAMAILDTGVVNSTTWTALEMVADGTLVHFYINGVEVGGTGVAIGGTASSGLSLGVGFSSVAQTTTSANNFAADYVQLVVPVTR